MKVLNQVGNVRLYQTRKGYLVQSNTDNQLIEWYLPNLDFAFLIMRNLSKNQRQEVADKGVSSNGQVTQPQTA